MMLNMVLTEKKGDRPAGRGGQGVEMGANQNRLTSEQRTQGTGG